MKCFWRSCVLWLLPTSAAAAGVPDAPRVCFFSEISGALSRETVQRVFRLHRNEIRACYERGLQHDKDLQGSLAVRLNIGPDGSTHDTTLLESSVQNSRVEQCVVATVAAFEFPAVPGGGGTVVTYRFKLQRGPARPRRTTPVAVTEVPFGP